MKLDIFLSKTSNLSAENKILRFAMVLLFIISLVSIYTNLYLLKYSKTIILPPNIHTPIELKGDRFDDDYLKTMVRYIVFLAFNYTQANVSSQFEELLKLYPENTYATAKVDYYRIAEDVSKAGLSSVVNLYGDMAIQRIDNRIIITVNGNRKIFKDIQIIENYNANYEIRAHVEKGRFYIDSISEKRA